MLTRVPPSNPAQINPIDSVEQALFGAAKERDSLTLLHGTLGQGKTAILDLLHGHLEKEGDIRVVRVDVGGVEDADGFWCAIQEAAQAEQSKKERVSSVAARRRGECHLWVETWAENLSQRTVLLIDSYQTVTNPEMDLALAGLLEAHAHLQAVVASRAFAVLGGPTVAARLPITVIDVDEVSFDGAGETSADALSVGRGTLAGASGKLSSEGELKEELVALSEEERAVVTALALLGPTSPTILCPLLDLSLARCIAATRELQRRGLVKRWRTGGRTIFSVGAAANEAIKHGGFALKGVDAEDLRLRHALQLAAEDPMTALALLAPTRNLKAGDQVADAHFPTLLAGGRRTHDLLADLDMEELKRAPMLLGLRLHLAVRHGLEPSEETRPLARLLRCALLSMEDPQERLPERPGSSLPVDQQGLLMATERILGNWDEALRHAAELEVRVAEHDHHDLFQRESGPLGDLSGLPLLCFEVGLTAMLGGERSLALRCTARALSYAEQNRDVHTQMRANFLLALLHSIAFSLGGSGEPQRDAEAIFRRSGLGPERRTDVAGAISRSLQQFVGGDVAAAKETLNDLETWVENSELWPMSVVVGARLRHHLDGPRAGLRYIQGHFSHQRDTPPISPFARNMLVSRAADLATIAGEVAVARELIDSEIRENPGALPYASRARLQLLVGDTAGAVNSLQKALHEPQQHLGSTEFELLAATIWFSAGDSVRAFQTLDEAAPALVQTAPGMLTSWIPFGPLRDLAVGARNAGHADVLAHIDAIPLGARPVGVEPLSAAEERTLRAVAGVETIAEGAEVLGLSENTVKYHLRNIYRKLGARTKEEAVRTARGWGMLDGPSGLGERTTT